MVSIFGERSYVSDPTDGANLLVQKECRGEYESGLVNGLGQGVGYNVDLVLIQVMKRAVMGRFCSTANNQAEKDGPPNISLHAFYVIDNAKKAVEALCPKTVSCADILELAARDAVTLSGGPTWDVPKGRKDGRVSKATDTRQLPASLKSVCPAKNTLLNAGAYLDSTPTTFDNRYYKLLLQGKSIFSSDQALVTMGSTKALVIKYASSKQEFENALVKSMIKMSSINGGGQEVRHDCRVVN
ncbi:peroxidase 64-like protein [Tanacetum coccineum]